jgi:hypothetical protein
MKLPNSDRAIVELGKLTDYSLNPEHPSGRHKARVFRAALGLGVENAAYLRDVLLEMVRTHDATAQDPNDYGNRYVIDFELETFVGKARVRSAWIIRNDENFPRLTSCFVIK